MRQWLLLLQLILCSFIHNIVGIAIKIQHKHHISVIDSFSTVSTSFIIPIQWIDSEWFLSNAPNSYTRKTTPLQSFLYTLQNHHHDPQTLHIQLQLEMIHKHESYNRQLHTLSQIINQSELLISNIIIPQHLNTKIIQTISNQNLPTSILLQPISPSTSRRILTSNHSQSTINYTTITVETFLCKPWPIYIAFFCGIGVTVVITLAISVTTGENDNELHNALEKLITAGIENSVKNTPDGVEICGAPTPHKRGRTSSLMILNGLSPKSRSRSIVFVKGNMNHSRKYSQEPSWANDLNLSLGIKDRLPTRNSWVNEQTIHNALECNDKDKERAHDEDIQYKTLNHHRNSLVIDLTDIGAEITSKSGDIFNSSNSSKSGGIFNSSDEMSVSELTGRKSGESESDQDSSDSSIHSIKIPIWDQEEIKQQTKAENIDLSPIEESDATVNLFGMCQQRYKVAKRNKTGAQYIKRFSGKTIRVGLNAVVSPNKAEIGYIEDKNETKETGHDEDNEDDEDDDEIP